MNEDVTMEEMRLDGNAAGGSLAELFARDMTMAVVTCAKCGKEMPMGSLLEYGQAMGVVLRCVGCEAAMLRLVRTPGSLRLDPSGISLLLVAD
jgi:hypothetical protein